MSVRAPSGLLPPSGFALFGRLPMMANQSLPDDLPDDRQYQTPWPQPIGNHSQIFHDLPSARGAGHGSDRNLLTCISTVYVHRFASVQLLLLGHSLLRLYLSRSTPKLDRAISSVIALRFLFACRP